MKYYSNRQSAFVEIWKNHGVGRKCFFYSFGSSVQFGPFKSTFHAVLDASHRLKRSMKECDWGLVK